MDFKNAFKVISRKGNLLTSYSIWVDINKPEAGGGIIYIPNEWVHPHPIAKEKGYGLCVFSHIGYVRDFLLLEEGFTDNTAEIFSCLIDEEYEKLPHRQSVVNAQSLRFDNPFIPSAMRAWPKGTLMTNGVMLLKEISKQELLRC